MNTDCYLLASLIIAAASCLSGDVIGTRMTSSCPKDVRLSGTSCVRKFEEARHFSNSFQLTSGLDVELIRTICSEVRDASRCINRLKDRCPALRHREIMGALKLHLNLIIFCSKDNAIEEYALTQSCLQNERTHLARCHEALVTSTSGYLNNDVTSWSTDVIAGYCRSIDIFLHCFTDHVTDRCDESSGRVAERLARVAVPQSIVCFGGDSATGNSTRTSNLEISVEMHRSKGATSVGCLWNFFGPVAVASLVPHIPAWMSF